MPTLASQVSGSISQMVLASELVACHSIPKERLKARPEIGKSGGLHSFSVSPGVGHEGPATL